VVKVVFSSPRSGRRLKAHANPAKAAALIEKNLHDRDMYCCRFYIEVDVIGRQWNNRVFPILDHRQIDVASSLHHPKAALFYENVREVAGIKRDGAKLLTDRLNERRDKWVPRAIYVASPRLQGA
jgi:hypothetical protein